MAIPIKKYRLRAGRIKSGELVGFSYNADQDRLDIVPGASRCRMIPRRIDSATPGCIWGRVTVEAAFPQDSAFLLYYYASDLDEPRFDAASRMVGAFDGLLYEQQGRYLFLWIEVLGAEEGWVHQINLYTPGDTFMATFPEVYQEHGSFFHRYLSIFSSVYLDLQQKIDRLDDYLDLDRTPEKMLPLIGQWLGITLQPELFSAGQMRAVLNRAHFLNSHKGSRAAVEEIARLIAGSGCMVVERSRIGDGMQCGESETMKKLYGNSPYDYTLIIPCAPDARLREQLVALLHQFEPVRARANLVFLRESATLGSYTYLDVNAALRRTGCCAADSGMLMDAGGCLK